MAYRYDQASGTFVRNEAESPVSRRRPLSATLSAQGAPQTRPAAQPSVQQETPAPQEPSRQEPGKRRTSSRTREQAGEMTYNPKTGNFVIPRKRKAQATSSSAPVQSRTSASSRTTSARQASTVRTSSSRTRTPQVSPTIVHRWGRTPFSTRLEWFFSRVMTRVAVYIVAGFIISMCTHVFR